MPKEDGLRSIAFACAIFLLLAIAMPNWLAHTSWTSGGRNNGMSVVDSPASYIGLVSLCGTIAFVVLSIGLWQRRWEIVTALAAASAFAWGTYVIGNYWLGLSNGVILLDGSSSPEMGPPRWTVHWPPMLPLFIFAAVIGAMSALALAVDLHRKESGNS